MIVDGPAVERSQRQNALEQEFHSAQEIRWVLIPETLLLIAGYSLTSAYLAAQEVGGDFFQIIPFASNAGNQSAIIVLGDPAAIFKIHANHVARLISCSVTQRRCFLVPNKRQSRYVNGIQRDRVASRTSRRNH